MPHFTQYTKEELEKASDTARVFSAGPKVAEPGIERFWTRDMFGFYNENGKMRPPLPFPSVIVSEEAIRIGYPNSKNSIDLNDPENRLQRIEDRLDALEESNPKGLIITGSKVTEAWAEITRERKTK